MPFQEPAELARAAATLFERTSPDAYPQVAAVTRHALTPGYAYADEFLFGLDLILDALERGR